MCKGDRGQLLIKSQLLYQLSYAPAGTKAG